MDETNAMDNQNYAGLQQDRNADQPNDPVYSKDYSAAASKAKIGALTGLLLILVALGIDGLQAFLDLIIIGVVLNWIIDIFAWLLFFIWLKMLGISMADGKGTRALIFLGLAFGFELLPILNALPGWTAFAVGVVVNEFGSKVFEKVPIVGKFIKKT